MIEKHEWVKHGPDTGDSLDSIENLDINDSDHRENTFEVWTTDFLSAILWIIYVLNYISTTLYFYCFSLSMKQ